MKKLHTHVKTTLRFIAITVLTLGIASSCAPKPAASDSTNSGQTPQELLVKSADQISIMTFNVENMFDAIHDVNTEDYPYLPLTEKKSDEVKKFCSSITGFYRTECLEKDWNEDIVKFKLSQVGKTVKYVENGNGPDIILMAEVENLRILNRLADDELKGMGYQTRVLIEGPDLRGIDPAIMSKFPLKGKPVLHIIPYTDKNPEQLKYAKRSRGVIEATLILPNKKELTVMAVHFPSQSNPTEWRAQAVSFLKNKMLEYQKQGRAVIAGGDMNIVTKEESNSGYFSKELSQAGSVSHLVGCKQCEGSHNYKGEWSFLDVMVFGNGLSNAGLELIPESLQIVKAPHHMKKNGAPLSFRDEKKEGVSDHFPLYSKLKIK